MFVKSLLPLTVAGFLLFGAADEVNLKLGLYDCAQDYKLVESQSEMLLYKSLNNTDHLL